MERRTGEGRPITSPVLPFIQCGGAGGGRTHYLFNAIEALSEFHLPHGAWIDRRGRLLITDRENDRIQVFSQDGEHLTSWPTELIGAAVICIDDEDIVYVAEHNGGMISILNLDGERLAQWGSLTHRSCHGIWVDSHKDLYVVEPYEGSQGRTVVKFTRKG